MQLTKYPSTLPVIRLFIAVISTFVAFAAYAGGVSSEHEVSWLQQLAKSGDNGAQLQLGLAYMHGRYDLKPDTDTGRYWLCAAAKGGNAYAADVVAHTFTKKSDKHQQEALPWWKLGASGGNADAQEYLSKFMLRRGDNEQAVKWLRHSADRGDLQAHYELVKLYHKVQLTEADFFRGNNRIAVLGEQVDSPGIKSLFAIWHTVEASSPYTQSSESLINRAEQGDPVAEYQLGVRYGNGAWAVERDPQKAMTWMKRAAEAGHPIAEKMLSEVNNSS